MVLIATQVKRRRGTTAENDVFTGAEGEITVDLGNKELRVHDGSKQGGFGTARKDLTNLTEEAKNIGNWSHNVSNCITEIPQDIKLELNNGTLTLKAGAKVYVPNGFEQDGTTPKFDEIITTTDLTFSNPSLPQGQYLIMYKDGTLGRSSKIPDRVASGSTPPTGGTGWLWYNTSDNKMYAQEGSSFVEKTNWALPLGIISGDDTNISSIDQVFNGIGYIGTAVFMLPGISALIPNGLNSDGSCKNIAFTNPSVYVYDNATAVERNVGLILDSSGNIISIENSATSNTFVGLAQNRPNTVANTNNNYWYSTDENQWYNTSGSTTANWEKAYPVFLGKRKTASLTTYFESKSSFCAVDRSDREFFAHQAMPSDRYIDLTLGASGSTYTAPADGYVGLGKSVNAANQYVDIFYSNTGVHSKGYGNNNGDWATAMLSVSKGQSYTIQYNAGGQTRYFKFVYAQGAQ